jgi:hypothetical protein
VIKAGRDLATLLEGLYNSIELGDGEVREKGIVEATRRALDHATTVAKNSRLPKCSIIWVGKKRSMINR